VAEPFNRIPNCSASITLARSADGSTTTARGKRLRDLFEHQPPRSRGSGEEDLVHSGRYLFCCGLDTILGDAQQAARQSGLSHRFGENPYYGFVTAARLPYHCVAYRQRLQRLHAR
jgi:hypothetical protein